MCTMLENVRSTPLVSYSRWEAMASENLFEGGYTWFEVSLRSIMAMLIFERSWEVRRNLQEYSPILCKILTHKTKPVLLNCWDARNVLLWQFHHSKETASESWCFVLAENFVFLRVWLTSPCDAVSRRRLVSGLTKMIKGYIWSTMLRHNWTLLNLNYSNTFYIFKRILNFHSHHSHCSSTTTCVRIIGILPECEIWRVKKRPRRKIFREYKLANWLHIWPIKIITI